MALLHLFHTEGYLVEAAHVNFRLRGADSNADEALVATFCRERGIPFHTRSFETKAYAAERGISTQMAARELRYAWFEEVAEQRGLDKIATAHHLLDNLETLLLNITKGTGPRGLTGIPMKTGRVIRPLLHASPELLLAYLEENHIPWREDLSNREDHYQRNKVRNRVIPLLKEINPGLEHTFSANLQRFSDLETIFGQQLQSFEASLLRNGEEIRIPLAVLGETTGLTLEEFLKPYGFTRQEAILVLNVSETGKKILSPTHLLIRERDHWRLTPKQEVTVVETQVTGEGIFPVGKRFLSVKRADVHTVQPDYSNPYMAWLDARAVSWPLRIRPWKGGDRFIPYGMKGSRLVSDYLKDRKVSASEKKEQQVVEDASGILWLAGHRIADRFKITEDTQEILHLEIRENE